MRTIVATLAGVLALSFVGCGCLTDDCGPKTTPTVSRAEPASAECGAYVLIPARYESVCDQVCVQPASVQKLHVDAVYKNVCDTVIATPGRWVETPCAAVYKDVSERVLITPARKEWRKAPCADVVVNNGEQRGDAYCLVEIAAVYETKCRKVCVSAESTKREWIPPTYKTVERQVMVSAAYDKEIPVEAKYESRSRQELVAEARWEWRWGTECPPSGNAVPVASIPSPPPPVPVSPGPYPATTGAKNPSEANN